MGLLSSLLTGALTGGGASKHVRRSAKYAKQARNAARLQTVLTVSDYRHSRRQQQKQAPSAPQLYQPGWWPDEQNPAIERYHDGTGWTAQSRIRA